MNSIDQQQLRAGGLTSTSVNAAANNQLLSCFLMVRSSGTNRQEHWNNLDAGSQVRTLASISGPSGGSGLYLGSSATPSTSNSFTGRLLEVQIWDDDDNGAGPTFPEWKAYTETRHGVVWA